MPKCLRSGDKGSKPHGVPCGVAQIFCAALGPYVSDLTNVTSKCSKRQYVLNDMSVIEGNRSRHVCEKQGAIGEALEDTCQ